MSSWEAIVGIIVLVAVFALSIAALWKLKPGSRWWVKESGLDEVKDSKQLTSIKRGLTGVLVFVCCLMVLVYLLAVVRVAG